MIRGRAALAAVAVTVLVASGSSVEARRDRLAAIKAGIAAANREFMARVARGNGDEVAALYAEDAKLLPPDAPAVSGRGAIAAFWEAAIDSGIAEIALTTEDVVASRDAVTEVASYRLKGKDTAVLDEGKAIVIWKRIDGRWLLWRDMFSSNRPAKR